MRHCQSLVMLSLITLLLLSVGNGGAYWPYSGGQPVDATTLVNAPAGAAVGPAAGGMSSGSSYHDLRFVNNGCEYHNGMITENGGQARKATAEEKAKVKEYFAASQHYQEQLQQSMAEQMRRIFAPPFPFGQSAAAWQFPQFAQFPKMPMADTPCFCESCRNAASQSHQQAMSSVMGESSGTNSANTFNQYSVVDGQQQQQQQPKQ